ncbi:B3 domain-containing protein [Canna indica]|uniref:B3 domain-containing protein n=1 Tax=Canna indica TaxID=4628 RepID=A0AAQ3K423_9LILI|nr:B3 domain-containing protein [Canna indica]
MTGKKNTKTKSKRPPARTPHFFKVLLGNFAQQLRIPPSFLKHISAVASERVNLQGPNGRGSWNVGLGRRPEGTCLLSGWPDFVKDNLLEEHDFLMFQYDRNKHFTVFMFDKTGCEKEDVSLLATCEEDEVLVGDQGIGYETTDCLKDVVCYVPRNEATLSHLSFPLPRHTKLKMKDNGIPTVLSLESKHTKGHRPKRRLVSDEERAKVRQAAYSFRSIHPFFVSCMTASSISKSYTLKIPSYFSQAYFPQNKVNLVLRDPSGRAWKVAYIPYPPGYLSAGWSAFVRGNNLEEGDYCAIELVSPAELRVNIFKVVQNSNPGSQGMD